MNLRNFGRNQNKRFEKKYTTVFYQIQNGGKSKEADIMGHTRIFFSFFRSGPSGPVRKISSQSVIGEKNRGYKHSRGR